MKGLILWTGVVAFMALAMAAVKQHEWTIAAVMGAVSFVCLWAAPGGDKSSKKSERGEVARR